MRRLAVSLLMSLAAIGVGGMGGVLAQTTVDEARQQGKDLGTQMRADSSLQPTDAKAAGVPGYNGTNLPEQTYFDNPNGLTPAGAAAASSNAAYGVATDRDHTRATFSNSDILATTNRATTIEKDPESYVAGEAMNGGSGTCNPLPPSSTGTDYYEATCNSGTKIDQGTASCQTPLIVDATPGSTEYVYTCENWSSRAPRSADNTARRCQPAFNAAVSGGVCRERSRRTVYYSVCLQGTINKCFEPDLEEGEEITYECDSAAIPNRGYVTATKPAIINVHRDESVCTAATTGQTCDMTAEVCTDADPSTRTINGVQVTQACWNWQRTYSCYKQSQASDCSDLEGNKQCTYVRDDCLDDPQSDPCKVSQKVYKCPTPSTGTAPPNQYVCGGDVYCLNGNCETIDREASPDFKDALVALHSLGDAGAQFDPNNLTVFSGERDTCHKKIFGAANCCSGKGVPLVTPWLCDSAEKKLKEREDKGLCHKVGSYCSDKILGICVTSKDAWCCFGSKLARLLQEQGRAQINKPWASAKTESCKGFSIAEFQQLDLSKMDFSEVYAEFQDAAKLPDEVSTMTDIQSKIQGYYALHGGK